MLPGGLQNGCSEERSSETMAKKEPLSHKSTYVCLTWTFNNVLSNIEQSGAWHE